MDDALGLARLLHRRDRCQRDLVKEHTAALPVGHIDDDGAVVVPGEEVRHPGDIGWSKGAFFGIDRHFDVRYHPGHIGETRADAGRSLDALPQACRRRLELRQLADEAVGHPDVEAMAPLARGPCAPPQATPGVFATMARRASMLAGFDAFVVAKTISPMPRRSTAP